MKLETSDTEKNAPFSVRLLFWARFKTLSLTQNGKFCEVA